MFGTSLEFDHPFVVWCFPVLTLVLWFVLRRRREEPRWVWAFLCPPAQGGQGGRLAWQPRWWPWAGGTLALLMSLLALAGPREPHRLKVVCLEPHLLARLGESSLEDWMSRCRSLAGGRELSFHKPSGHVFTPGEAVPEEPLLDPEALALGEGHLLASAMKRPGVHPGLLYDESENPVALRGLRYHRGELVVEVSHPPGVQPRLTLEGRTLVRSSATQRGSLFRHPWPEQNAKLSLRPVDKMVLDQDFLLLGAGPQGRLTLKGENIPPVLLDAAQSMRFKVEPPPLGIGGEWSFGATSLPLPSGLPLALQSSTALANPRSHLAFDWPLSRTLRGHLKEPGQALFSIEGHPVVGLKGGDLHFSFEAADLSLSPALKKEFWSLLLEFSRRESAFSFDLQTMDRLERPSFQESGKPLPLPWWWWFAATGLWASALWGTRLGRVTPR